MKITFAWTILRAVSVLLRLTLFIQQLCFSLLSINLADFSGKKFTSTGSKVTSVGCDW